MAGLCEGCPVRIVVNSLKNDTDYVGNSEMLDHITVRHAAADLILAIAGVDNCAVGPTIDEDIIACGNPNVFDMNTVGDAINMDQCVTAADKEDYFNLI